MYQQMHSVFQYYESIVHFTGITNKPRGNKIDSL